MAIHRPPPRAVALALAALLVTLLVLGCAPATVGSRSAPYLLGRDAAIAARPGDVVFVQVDMPPDTFRLGAAELAGRWQPWTPTMARAVATYRFSLRDVIVPDGWELSIDRAVAYLTVGRGAADIELLLRLQVPSGARLGGQRVRAQLDDRDGRSAPIEIVVQVSR
jgi:hypothetical protein